MRIATRLYFLPKYFCGGLERQMVLIGRNLLKWNIDFHIITKKVYKNQPKYEIQNDIKIHNICNRAVDVRNRTFKERFYNMFYSYDLLLFLRYFRKFNFNIYHLRGANDITGIWAFFAKIIKRKKFVFTTSHIKNCIPGSYPWSRFTTKIYEYGLKRADVVVVLAEYMKKALYQNYGIKSIVIKSGHPVPKEPFKKDNPPTILWLTRLLNWKRPELFLKIVEELKNLKAHFILIGKYWYKKNQIMAFAEKYKNFTFIPGVPAGIDNEYYERASLFVNTSVYEGYPNSFIQAWLHETPVMSLDVDPDCDIYKNGLGYHAKGNLNDLINKIKELIENPNKLKEMGKNCRKYAIQNHDIKKTAEQHYKLYKWLLKKK